MLLHIVLFEPEIPHNNRNIIRLCANTRVTPPSRSCVFPCSPQAAASISRMLWLLCSMRPGGSSVLSAGDNRGFIDLVQSHNAFEYTQLVLCLSYNILVC